MPVIYLWSSSLCCFVYHDIVSFASENDVNVELGIGISHDVRPQKLYHMSPLWGFGYLVNPRIL